MSRIIRILVGLALVAYGLYSGNAWFYLGVIPLIMGIINWCPMEKLMGAYKDKECSTGSCGTNKTKEGKTVCCSSTKEEKESSYCSTQESIVEEKTTCCSSSKDKVVIKILGTGCPNCIALKKVVDEAIKSIDKEFEVIKVEDIQEIMKYNIVSTPGLVINDEIKSAGKLLTVEEVKALINGMNIEAGTKIKTKCCSK